MKKSVLMIALAAALVSASAASAGTWYKFTVTCPDGSGVAEWRTGDLDPGEEWLRMTTGANNPGCSVSPYDPAEDRRLPVTVYHGSAAVVQGIPGVGEVLESIFGW